MAFIIIAGIWVLLCILIPVLTWHSTKDSDDTAGAAFTSIFVGAFVGLMVWGLGFMSTGDREEDRHVEIFNATYQLAEGTTISSDGDLEFIYKDESGKLQKFEMDVYELEITGSSPKTVQVIGTDNYRDSATPWVHSTDWKAIIR